MHHLFTAENIHAAYVARLPRSAKPWDEVPGYARQLDKPMAHSLTIQEATIRARRALRIVSSYGERYKEVAQEGTPDGNE